MYIKINIFKKKKRKQVTSTPNWSSLLIVRGETACVHVCVQVSKCAHACQLKSNSQPSTKQAFEC